jgi:glycosyltransferase involved in cell wall biosynthesis
MLTGAALKILHVDPEKAFHGGERQVVGLLRHLAARGHQNVLAAAPGGALASLVYPAEARFRPLAIRNDLDLLAALRLRRLIAAENPHVLHFHTSRAHAMSLWLGRHSRRRAVVTRRMDYPLRRGLRTELLYNRAVAAVVAISEDVRRRLLAAGVRPERISLIHSAVEPSPEPPGPAARSGARARLGLSDEATIGIVAALERRKGHDVLLRALARLREAVPRACCLVCGDGSERASLERLADELGVRGLVRFLGEQRQIADVLAALDVFVQPSRYEGLGVAVLEAMAAGLPVVASRVGGIPEAVQEGKTGLLVAKEEPEALAAAIAELLQDPARAARMGAEGRRRVLAEFSMEAMADRYERLYQDLIRS